MWPIGNGKQWSGSFLYLDLCMWNTDICQSPFRRLFWTAKSLVRANVQTQIGHEAMFVMNQGRASSKTHSHTILCGCIILHVWDFPKKILRIPCLCCPNRGIGCQSAFIHICLPIKRLVSDAWTCDQWTFITSTDFCAVCGKKTHFDITMREI